MEKIPVQLEYDLYRFRDKMKNLAEDEYNLASCEEPDSVETRMSLQFSNTLLKLSRELNEVISNYKI